MILEKVFRCQFSYSCHTITEKSRRPLQGEVLPGQDKTKSSPGLPLRTIRHSKEYNMYPVHDGVGKFDRTS
jgi:hypothetical protein